MKVRVYLAQIGSEKSRGIIPPDLYLDMGTKTRASIFVIKYVSLP